MSLIDEALKRAQAARPPGVVDPGQAPLPAAVPTPVPLPDSRRARRPLAPLLLAVAAGAALVGAAIWIVRGRPSAVPRPRAHPAAPYAPISSSERAVPAPAAAGKVSSRKSSVAGQSRSTRKAAVPHAPQRRDHPRADASASGKAAEEHREVPVERRHYIGEARLAGGARIELGGIVYSEDHPVALVNGRILGPGSSIEGFTIVAIHEDRIELRASDRAIVISLR